MGGSSIKKIFRKKKKSRWKKTWKKMKKALPTRKHKKKKSNGLLDKLNPRKKKNPEKEKESKSLKRVFFGKSKKEPSEDATPAEKKDEGALGKLKERMKSKMGRKPSNGLSKVEEAASPVNPEKTKEQNDNSSSRKEEKEPTGKLKEIMKSIRPTRSRTKDAQEKEA